MRVARPEAGRGHGALGVGLLVVTVAMGLQALIVGVGAGWFLPAEWLGHPAAWPRPVARLIASCFGLFLLLTAGGVWRFRRWGWWSGLVLGVLMVVSLLTEGARGGRGLVIEVGYLSLALWIPYLWLRRDAFR